MIAIYLPSRHGCTSAVIHKCVFSRTYRNLDIVSLIVDILMIIWIFGIKVAPEEEVKVEIDKMLTEAGWNV